MNEIKIDYRQSKSLSLCFDFYSWVSLDSLWGSSVSSVNDGSDLDDSGVNGTTDTVLHLEIKLGDDVEFESSIFLQIFFG